MSNFGCILNFFIGCFFISNFACAQLNSYRPPAYTPPPPTFQHHYYGGGGGLSIFAKKLKGYIINIKGDTIKGKILYKGLIATQYGVKLLNPDKTKTNYEASHVKNIYFEDDVEAMLFETHTIDGNAICLQRLTHGYIKLYAKYWQNFQGLTLPTYYTQKGNGTIREFGTFRAGLGSDNFRETASSYFSDYPDLANKIEEKDYRLDDIIQVFIVYNEWHVKNNKEVKSDRF